MIKLIVSDLDGTLLNSKKQLPRNFDALLKELSSHNIKFIAASGRPIYTLKHNFNKVKDNLLYIGDNGGVVEVNKKKTIINPINPSLVTEVIKKYKQLKHPNLHIVLCSPTCAYVESTDAKANSEIDIYYVNKQTVENIEEVKDTIVKITFYSDDNIEKIAEEIFIPCFKDNLQLAISGSVWLDIMAKGINKGTALRELQSTLCILPQETMVFGDYFNDIEMFQNASYSFAMEDSPDKVKELARYVIGKNDDEAVVTTIYEFLKKSIY